MNSRITLEELESYLWQSAVLLRTNIDAGSYKQYIFPLMFYKRICDVYDEETEAAVEKYGDDVVFYPEEELHTFIVPREHHWKVVRQVTEDVGQAIVAAFRAIEKENGELLTGIFGDGAWTNKNRLPDRLLKDLLEHFSSCTLSLQNCPEDELGQGYEYLIKKFADDSGHTAREFYTNRTVVHLMTEILKPQSGESIYDPACGSGGMFVQAARYMRRHNASAAEQMKFRCYGVEKEPDTIKLAKMNLMLNNVRGDITEANSYYSDPYNAVGQFDYVMANPPFNVDEVSFDRVNGDARFNTYASLGYTVSADQDAALGSEIIYDQNTFQERFLQDIANAKESVVIVSPFVTVRRVRWIEGALARCVQKRVKASVVTRDPTTLPAKARGAAQTAIQTLRAQGVEVVCREGIHQKYAVMDDSVVWYGSINLLSFGTSQESVMRLVSSSIARALLGAK